MSNRDNGITDDVGTVHSGNAGSLGGIGEQDDSNSSSSAVFEVGKPIVIDPTAVTGSTAGSGSGSGEASSGSVKRGRGRPKGSGGGNRKAGAKNASASDIAGGLELVIYSSHAMLAALIKVPEFAIEQTEAKQLSIGIANVGRHYDMKINEKAVDWIFLIQTMAIVYGPRIAVMNMRSKENRNARRGVPPQPNTPPVQPTAQPPQKNDGSGTHFTPWTEPEDFDPEDGKGGGFIQ